MITLKINGDALPITSRRDIDASWIANRINGLKHNQLPVCVKVAFQTRDLCLTFVTHACGGGGGRGLYPHEEWLWELWVRHGLDKPDFTIGNVISFLQAVMSRLN